MNYEKLGKNILKDIYPEGGPSIEQIEEDYWKYCQDDSKSILSNLL